MPQNRYYEILSSGSQPFLLFNVRSLVRPPFIYFDIESIRNFLKLVKCFFIFAFLRRGNKKNMTIEDLLKEWNGGILRGAKKALADKLGVPDTSISHWIAGRANPSEIHIKAMTKIFKKSEQDLKDIFMHSDPKSGVEKYLPIETEFIPVLGISSATDEKFIVEERESFLPYRKTGENQFAIKVVGNCMVDPDDPRHSIYEGDYIIVDPDKEAMAGDVVLARIDEEYSTIKRFFIHGQKIYLVPDNPAYKKLIFDITRIHIVGKVIDVYKPMKRKPERK